MLAALVAGAPGTSDEPGLRRHMRSFAHQAYGEPAARACAEEMLGMLGKWLGTAQRAAAGRRDGEKRDQLPPALAIGYVSIGTAYIRLLADLDAIQRSSAAAPPARSQ